MAGSPVLGRGTGPCVLPPEAAVRVAFFTGGPKSWLSHWLIALCHRNDPEIRTPGVCPREPRHLFLRKRLSANGASDAVNVLSRMVPEGWESGSSLAEWVRLRVNGCPGCTS